MDVAKGGDGNGGDGSGGGCVIVALLDEDEVEEAPAPRFLRKNDGGVDAILDSALSCVLALSCFLTLSTRSLLPAGNAALDRLVADT